jgi:hypothetical protein
MRLLRLVTLAIVGYAIYELLGGMVDEGTGRRRHSSREDLRRALNSDSGRMNLTGTGRGQSVVTLDSDGAMSRHVVGRGVTHAG